ncbi:MAG: efflux RND transporter permease subunit [Deltaproteobacteria bacterium]|nr:efflux RND transporter permease subunit [Deltaproteobacteria bacterium]
MKRLVTFIVEQSTFTILFGVILLITGIFSVPSLKISKDPTIEYPTLSIVLTLPGASAREIEERVIYDIEDEFQNTRNLKKFNTKVYNGYATIKMEYEYGVDINDQYLDVSSKINKIKSDLPDDLEISIEKVKPTDMVVPFVYAVVSDIPIDDERNRAAEELKNLLGETVAELDEIKVLRPEEEIRITLNLEKLNNHGITINQVIAAIQSENQFLPTGTMVFGDKTLSILPPVTAYEKVEDIARTIIMTKDGSSLRLSDIADVKKTLKPDPVLYRVNGHPASLITIKFSDAANILIVKKGIEKTIEEFKAGLSEHITIVSIYDSERSVSLSLSDLLNNLIQGVLILTVVLLFSIGYRSTLVVALMLPLALGMAMVLLSLTDYGLQQISIAGFIISLGLIVDNGIVVTENAYKLNFYQHYNYKDAAIEGTASVIYPLVSSTLTTALAFAPLFMLTSREGLYLRSMSITIWFCLGASLLIAVTFSTILLSRIGCRNALGRLPSPPSFLNGLIPFRDKYFRSFLAWNVRHPFVLLAAVLVFFVITGLLAKHLKVIVFPASEEPYFTITVQAPGNSSSAFVDSITRKIESRLKDEPSVTRCTTVSGGPFPLVDFGIAWVERKRTNAVIFCNTDFRDSDKIAQLVDKMNRRLSDLSAFAKINCAPFSVGGSAGEADITVNLYGNNIKDVRAAAQGVEKAIESTQGIYSIDNPADSELYSIRMQFDKMKAQAVGVPKQYFDQIMVLMTYGFEADTMRDERGEELDIFLRTEEDRKDPLSIFDRLFVSSLSGNYIPLSQIVSYTFDPKEYDIIHEKFKPTIKIDIFADPDTSVPELTRTIRDTLSAYHLPRGVGIKYEGEVESTGSAFGGLGKFTGIIALVIFGIFILQFKSILQPLIIYAAIPLCAIGAVIILFICNQPLSFVAFIGLTSLMGIVVNNSILLVDEGNRIREENPETSNQEIAVEAGRNRFMPILLTSLTTIVGLLPLALGKTMFKPLALVVIGGLATSTFFTLICIPTLYVYLTSRKKG